MEELRIRFEIYNKKYRNTLEYKLGRLINRKEE